MLIRFTFFCFDVCFCFDGHVRWYQRLNLCDKAVDAIRLRKLECVKQTVSSYYNMPAVYYSNGVSYNNDENDLNTFLGSVFHIENKSGITIDVSACVRGYKCGLSC